MNRRTAGTESKSSTTMGPQPTASSLHPNDDMGDCQTCDAEATGLHYGAYTCASCKAFFHRMLKTKRTYRCRGQNPSGLCDYIPGTKRSCQYCRYQRCLAAGMSLEAIKNGRYSVLKSNKKGEKTKSDQQHKGKIGSTRIVQEADSSGTVDDDYENTDDSEQSRLEPSFDEASSQETFRKRQSGNNDSPKTELNTDTPSPEAVTFTDCGSATGSPDRFTQQLPFDNILPSVTPITAGIAFFGRWRCSDGDSMDSEEIPEESNVPGLSTSFKLISDTIEDFDGQLPLLSNQTLSALEDISRAQHFNLETQDSQWALTPTDTNLTSNQTGVSLFDQYDSQSSSAFSIINDFRCDNALTFSPTVSMDNMVWDSLRTDHSLLPPRLETPMYNFGAIPSHLSLLPSPDPFTHTKIECLYTNRDDVIQRLLRADEDNLQLHFFPPEEIHRQQMMHLESCFQRRCTFGSLRLLPEKEYDELYKETGIDIDGRHTLMKNFIQHSECLMRNIINFAQSIPGFTYFNASETVELLKHCRGNIRLMYSYRLFNKAAGVGMALDGTWICMDELPLQFTQFFKDALELCDNLQKMQICKEEMAIIHAIVLINSGRQESVDSPNADVIYTKLYHLLMYVCVRHRHSPATFVRYLNMLNDFYAYSKRHMKTFQSSRLYKYSSVMTNPFHRVLFINLVPKEERDSEILANSVKDEDVLKSLYLGS